MSNGHPLWFCQFTNDLIKTKDIHWPATKLQSAQSGIWARAANLKLYSSWLQKSELRHMVDPLSVFCPAFLFWPTWEHISKYVIPILLRMQRACCFSEMAVLRGMICFRRNDAGADRIPNNNHLAMNISPGRVVARMTISQVSDLAHKDIFHFVRFIIFFSGGTNRNALRDLTHIVFAY